MAYRFIGEDDKSLTVAYPDGTEFPMAKNALSDSVQERIRALGAASPEPVVEAPSDPVVESILGPRAPSSVPDPSPLPTLPASSRAPSPGATGSWSEDPAPAPTAAQTQQAGIAALMANPPQAPQAAPSAAAPRMANPFGAGYGQMAAGIQGTADAKVQEGKDQQAALQGYAATLPSQDALIKRQADIEARRQALQAETDALQKTVLEGKIDPNRMWNNTSSGNKVMATIGVLLSGIGSGLQGNGAQNLALKGINDAIDRDIDAQKANLNKSQNMLSMNMKRFGDLDSAEAATRLQMNTILQTNLQMAAVKSGTEQAKAAAQLGIGQLKNQQAQLMAQLAVSQQGLAEKQVVKQESRALFDGTGLNRLSPEVMSSPELAKRIVFDPITKKSYGASSSEGAKLLNEALSAYTPLKQIITRMTELQTTGKITEAAAESRSLQAQFVLLMRKLNPGLGVLSEDDKKLLLNQAEDPNKWSEIFVRGAKSNATLRGMDTNVESMKTQYIPNYQSPTERVPSFKPKGRL